jgi:hypothetical protein
MEEHLAPVDDKASLLLMTSREHIVSQKRAFPIGWPRAFDPSAR